MPPIGHRLHPLQGNQLCVSRPSDKRRLTSSDKRNPCWRWRPKALPRILNYFPIYQNADDTQEDYARVKLMLHHPHRRFEDLKQIDGVSYTTYVEAYQHCQQHHQDHPQDYYGRFDESDATPVDDEHAEEYTEKDEDLPREAWQELANIIPQHAPDEETVQILGNRDIDLAYSWAIHVGRYVVVCGNARFFVMFKRREQPGEAVVRALVNYPSQLNSEQLAVWQIFRTHCRQRGVMPAPILMQVDGAGGTGKSFLIHAVSDVLESELPGSVTTGFTGRDSLST
ncbi:hypothetical protein E4U60_000278 [Claviceps pazoutovae]|uniref:ATP-dependent DNA helicase n=1 Tax=Claviceps pazoutovae TaxID=1649127 RepID=A0A9P7SAU3_9HYPO|nr:hypothetical protein E4U60_000278 [Claviceps pazoutovae]